MIAQMALHRGYVKQTARDFSYYIALLNHTSIERIFILLRLRKIVLKSFTAVEQVQIS